MVRNNRPFFAIYASRLVYAINWFTIAPALIFIQEQINVSPFDLGLIASAFFIGLMPFQILGGLIALRISPRILAISGMTLIGICSILSGISDSFLQLFFARVFLGIGSAIFSSPALSLLSTGDAEHISRRVGYYNALFSIGSGTSIVVWSLFDPVYGWRISMYSTGVLSLMCSVLLILYTERIQMEILSNVSAKNIFSTLRDGKRWMLGFSSAIAPLSETVIGQFFIYYSEKNNILSQFNSGLALSIYFITGFIGGIAYGRFYGKSVHRTIIYFITTILCSLLFIALSFLMSTYLILTVLWSIGFLISAILSMLYYDLVKLENRSNYLTFSLGFNNFMQKIISITSPVIFIFIAIQISYSEAWFVLGLSGLVLTFLYPGLYGKFSK